MMSSDSNAKISIDNCSGVERTGECSVAQKRTGTGLKAQLEIERMRNNVYVARMGHVECLTYP